MVAMKKSYKLIDLDCANCAQKMEDAIKKLDGVQDASVSFIGQKLTLSVEDGRLDEVMKQVVKTCKRIEPDCRIVL